MHHALAEEINTLILPSPNIIMTSKGKNVEAYITYASGG